MQIWARGLTTCGTAKPRPFRRRVRRRDAAHPTLVATGSDQSSDVVSARVSAARLSDVADPGWSRSRIRGGPITSQVVLVEDDHVVEALSAKVSRSLSR